MFSISNLSPVQPIWTFPELVRLPPFTRPISSQHLTVRSHLSSLTARRPREPSYTKTPLSLAWSNDPYVRSPVNSHSLQSPISSHGAFFGTGDLDRSPSVNPTFQRLKFDIAQTLDKRHQDARHTYCSREQYILVEYTSRRRWNMGFDAGHVPAAQFDGREL